MQILGYEITKNHLYLIGGLGLGSRIGFSLINKSNNKDNIKTDDNIKRNNDITNRCLIVDEDGTKANSLLLDCVETTLGQNSKEVRLLYQENKVTYIIYGSFIANNNTWRFNSNKVETYQNDTCKKVNCCNIESVAIRPNINFNKNDVDIFSFSGSTSAELIMNNSNKESTYGLKLDKHSIVTLNK
jgi:hypothetical protein